MEEIWKDIFDTGYKVSNMGRIMLPSGKITNHRKFKTYFSCPAGKVHQLVAYFFLPHPDAEKYGKYSFKGYHVHHKDGNKFNNCVDNLVYVTEEEHGKIHLNYWIPKPKQKTKREIFLERFINI